MVDAKDKHVTGVAMTKVAAETGLVIPNSQDLIPLGTYYSSPGGCDEKITLFAWKTSITSDKFASMTTNGKNSGPPGDIELVLHNITDDVESHGDAKLEIALSRYLKRFPGKK